MGYEKRKEDADDASSEGDSRHVAAGVSLADGDDNHSDNGEVKMEEEPIGKAEMVNHPKHYGGDTEYECIKVLKAWLGDDEYRGFLRGNAIKYLCRVGKKDESVQELKKVKWYVEKLIEACGGQE